MAIAILAAIALMWPARAQTPQAQPPDGSTLDSTLNYINRSLAQVSNGANAVTLNGTVLTETLHWGADREVRFVDLLDVDAKATLDRATATGDPVLNCRHNAKCAEDDYFSSSATRSSEIDRLDLNIEQGGNAPHAQDVADALTHLVALVRAQHKAHPQQSDPFANPG